jgi:hypothetical protein
MITIAVVLTGVSVLAVFWHELTGDRASATLLVAGSAAALVMVVTDVSGVAAIRVAEMPAQVFAVAMFTLAGVVRLREVQASQAVSIVPMFERGASRETYSSARRTR